LNFINLSLISICIFIVFLLNSKLNLLLKLSDFGLKLLNLLSKLFFAKLGFRL